MNELKRLELIEESVSQCAKSMTECSLNIELIQRDIKHQNENAEIRNQKSDERMYQIEQLLETQHIVLHGNPRQDTSDLGLTGDVQQLKSFEARVKKYYWAIIPVVVAALIPSVWNFISGGIDHGRSETKIKANKTSPGSRDIHGHNRSRRE